jgi:hypothetical protein
MAYDVVKKKQVRGEWCCGIGDNDADAGSDLPLSAKGYVPEAFWGPADMEAKISSFMSTKRGPFGLGGKPTRAEAVTMLVAHMRDNKIGPKDVAGMGSVVLSTSEQNRLYNKIDDVRYDIRRAGALAGAGIAAIAGSVAILGLAEMWRTIKGRA